MTALNAYAQVDVIFHLPQAMLSGMRAHHDLEGAPSASAAVCSGLGQGYASSVSKAPSGMDSIRNGGGPLDEFHSSLAERGKIEKSLVIDWPEFLRSMSRSQGPFRVSLVNHKRPNSGSRARCFAQHGIRQMRAFPVEPLPWIACAIAETVTVQSNLSSASCGVEIVLAWAKNTQNPTPARNQIIAQTVQNSRLVWFPDEEPSPFRGAKLSGLLQQSWYTNSARVIGRDSNLYCPTQEEVETMRQMPAYGTWS